MEGKTDFGTSEVLKIDEDASYTLEVVEPGKEVPLHHHEYRDETVIVIKGHTSKLEEGNTYFFSRRKGHRFLNDSDKPLKLLMIMKPPYDGKDIHFWDESTS